MRSRSVVWQLMLLTIILGAGAILAGCANAPRRQLRLRLWLRQMLRHLPDLDDVPPAATT